MKNNALDLRMTFLSTLLFISTLIFGCKKDSEEQATRKLLVSKTWKWSLTDDNPGSNPAGPMLYHALKDCSKDDVISFSTDGKYKIARGKTLVILLKKVLNTWPT